MPLQNLTCYTIGLVTKLSLIKIENIIKVKVMRFTNSPSVINLSDLLSRCNYISL